MLYIPRGFAHGYVTLEDDTEVAYLVGHTYVPAAGRGVRWDDPSVRRRMATDPDGDFPSGPLACILEIARRFSKPHRQPH